MSDLMEEPKHRMKYDCPMCNYSENHYSEALAHPHQGIYGGGHTYYCPTCSTGDHKVILDAVGSMDDRQLLQG